MRCRCDQHEWPDGGGDDHVAKVAPAGASNEAVVCGRCTTPGALFLDVDEYYQYRYDARRLFALGDADAGRIRLADEPVEVRESKARPEGNPPPNREAADGAAESNR